MGCFVSLDVCRKKTRGGTVRLKEYDPPTALVFVSRAAGLMACLWFVVALIHLISFLFSFMHLVPCSQSFPFYLSHSAHDDHHG
jgi:hypothetical protein